MPPDQLDFDPRLDYYRELGVHEKSSAEEIKRVYRQLARQYHPDSTGGDKAKESRFKAISVAYEVVGDPLRRKRYDDIRDFRGVPAPQAGPPSRGQYDNIFDFFGFGQPPEPEPESEPYHHTTSPFDGFDGHHTSETLASDGSLLRVEGVDVHTEVVIPFDLAMLGTTVTVATLDAKADVKIPAGSSSGRKLRLRGKGLRNPAGLQGDHQITVQIAIPAVLDDEDRQLVAHLAARLKQRR